MKFNKSVLVSFSVIIVSLVLCVLFRAVPVSRIWNSYSVLYADKSLSEEYVLSVLENHNVKETISFAQQKVPFVSSFTPVMPYESSAYLRERMAYFFDYSDTYSLYYVPKGKDSDCVKALEEISRDTNTICGIDGKAQYPWLVPLIVFLVFCVFTWLSKNRIVFILSASSVLVLSFSQVFYPVAAASVLYMLSCYLSVRLWGRKKALVVLRKNLYALIPIVVSVVSVMIISIQSAVLVLLCCASSVCMLLIYDSWEKYRDSKISMKIVKIFAAPQLPLMYPKTAKHTLMCLVPLVGILVIYLLTWRISSSSSSDISIPVPVHGESIDAGSEKSLPTINDFYRWSWMAKSFPYRSMNEKTDGEVKENDSLVIPRYEVVDDRIVETEAILMTYNEEFRDGVDKEIDMLNYGAVEKLMKKQGSDVSVVYRNSGESRGKTDGLGLVLILTCLFVPVLLLIIYVIKSGRKYR